MTARLVDWNDWHECFVLSEEDKSIARYGRTTLPSSAGAAEGAHVSPVVPGDMPLQTAPEPSDRAGGRRGKKRKVGKR